MKAVRSVVDAFLDAVGPTAQARGQRFRWCFRRSRALSLCKFAEVRFGVVYCASLFLGLTCHWTDCIPKTIPQALPASRRWSTSEQGSKPWASGCRRRGPGACTTRWTSRRSARFTRVYGGLEWFGSGTYIPHAAHPPTLLCCESERDRLQDSMTH